MHAIPIVLLLDQGFPMIFTTQSLQQQRPHCTQWLIPICRRGVPHESLSLESHSALISYFARGGGFAGAGCNPCGGCRPVARKNGQDSGGRNR